MDGAPDQDRDRDIGALAELAGLAAVSEQLAGRIAVLRAERARREAGIEIRRPAWKNLVFTGGPGAGKSRAAAAVARIYSDLGLLSYGNVIEIAAADLAGTTSRETGELVDDAVTRAGGNLLMISDTHAWARLPDRGQHVLRWPPASPPSSTFRPMTPGSSLRSSPPWREAGFTLAPAAASKAATALAQAERGHGSGNARLAVRC